MFFHFFLQSVYSAVVLWINCALSTRGTGSPALTYLLDETLAVAHSPYDLSCWGLCYKFCLFVCLFDLILYVPSTIFQLNRDRSSWVEPVLS